MLSSPVSTRRLLFNSLGPVFFKSFSYEFLIEIMILNSESVPNTSSGSNIKKIILTLSP